MVKRRTLLINRDDAVTTVIRNDSLWNFVDAIASKRNIRPDTENPVVNIAPTVTTQPSITGGTTTGSVLTLAIGAASGTPAPTPAIQWLRGTTAISGATGATYTLVSADEGKAISARVTWTNSAGSAQETSNAITGEATAPTATAPDKVAGLAYAASILSWSAPSDGGSPITGYDINIGPVGSWTQTRTSADTDIDLSDLAAGDWQARVRAKNAKGTGAWSNTLSFAIVVQDTGYQPDMTTGRVAQNTTSYGGRANVVPASYYFAGQDEMAAMNMMGI